MNKGEILWQSPVGNGPRNHPLLKGLDLPPLGDDIERFGVMATKTLLFVNVQRLDAGGRVVSAPWAQWGGADMDRKLLFVFDKRSGKLLRDIQLDGRSAAPPMTYMYKGKQYIVTAIGAGDTTEHVALSLPSR